MTLNLIEPYPDGSWAYVQPGLPAKEGTEWAVLHAAEYDKWLQRMRTERGALQLERDMLVQRYQSAPAADSVEPAEKPDRILPIGFSMIFAALSGSVFGVLVALVVSMLGQFNSLPVFPFASSGAAAAALWRASLLMRR